MSSPTSVEPKTDIEMDKFPKETLQKGQLGERVVKKGSAEWKRALLITALIIGIAAIIFALLLILCPPLALACGLGVIVTHAAAGSAGAAGATVTHMHLTGWGVGAYFGSFYLGAGVAAVSAGALDDLDQEEAKREKAKNQEIQRK